VDLARDERSHERKAILSLYDWQDGHMAHARECHARRQEERLALLG